jgi:Cof subfamily protein (haloacid dehalogenase superfamily)
MNKFKGYLILSDIDGTITNNRGEFTEENAAAIRYFQSEGGLVTVSSGRYPDFIDQFSAHFVPNTYVIGINGTVLFDPITRRPVVSKPVDDGVIDVLHAILRDRPEVKRITASAHDREIHIPREDFDRFDEILSTLGKPWHRFIIVQNAADTMDVLAYLKNLCGDRYNLDRSWSEGIEIHSPDSGKGELLPDMKALLAAAGNPIHTTVCVGDYENDISMLRHADIAYAVENAIDEVKDAADRITVHHNEHALAHIIADLEKDLEQK